MKPRPAGGPIRPRRERGEQKDDQDDKQDSVHDRLPHLAMVCQHGEVARGSAVQLESPNRC